MLVRAPLPEGFVIPDVLWFSTARAICSRRFPPPRRTASDPRRRHSTATFPNSSRAITWCTWTTASASSWDCKPSRARAARRIHAAAVRRRRALVRAARAHGLGAELSRRWKAPSRTRPAGRQRLGHAEGARKEIAHRHGRQAPRAVRRTQGRPRLHVFGRHALAARVRRCLRIHRDPDQAIAIADIKRDMDAPRRWIACCAATSGTARPKSPCARHSRRSAIPSRWPCSRRRPSWSSSTTKRSSSASPPFRCRLKC